MGLFDGLFETLSNIKHNRELYRSGAADKRVVVETTVGWRPDPWNRDDGFTADPGNNCLTTPSGNEEYHRVVRDSRRRKNCGEKITQKGF